MEHGANREGGGTTLTRTAPVIFVPGLSHADRGWDLLRRHLQRAGFAEAGSPLDGSSHPRGDIPGRAERLAIQVATLRTITSAERVHVVGHGVGGVVARYFVQLLGGEAVVDTLVTIGTPHCGSEVTPVGLGPAAAQLRPGSAVLRRLEDSIRPMPVRWINYFTEDDLFVRPAASGVVKDARLRAVNVLVTDHRQLSLALPTVVCRSVAHELAAVEHLAGFGAPLAALPGAIVRLDGAERALPTATDPTLVADRIAAIERSRTMHPSNQTSRPRRGLRLALPSGDGGAKAL
ncbi:MAG TPA: alpha/beta fold hydrolase [Acidimicrobiia bacterium]|nr:alpha/beta fold hydrolase [Acidimicrobiia bacterium]